LCVYLDHFDSRGDYVANQSDPNRHTRREDVTQSPKVTT